LSGVWEFKVIPNVVEYEERYCAFVDILGFSALVASIDRDSGLFEQIRQILIGIREAPELQPSNPIYGADFRAQMISDAVCLSAKSNSSGLGVLCSSLTELNLKLLHRGYFMRGAVVKGLLYHDDQIAFGNALIRAYNIEQTIALYPRIILTREIVSDIRDFETLPYTSSFENLLRQSPDGPYHLDILGQELHAITILVDQRERNASELNKTAKLLQTRLDEAVDNPRHFEKVQWFASYWNDVFRDCSDIEKVRGPGTFTGFSFLTP
jgi:hypothetical protein